MVAAAAGVNPVVEFLPMRRGETPTDIRATGEGWDRLCDDGWQRAGMVELESGLEETVDAYRAHPLVTD
jgi:hypothetical protein